MERTPDRFCCRKCESRAAERAARSLSATPQSQIGIPMKKCWMFAAALLCSTMSLQSTALSPQAQAPAPKTSARHTFELKDGQFFMDGRPFQILAGEMHYARIPRARWRQAMRMARAMGLNTVTTYVFWNLHEPEPGRFDFSGQNDLAEYLRIAQQEGLYVIL